MRQDGGAAEVIDGYSQAFTKSGMTGFYRHWLERQKSKPSDEQNSVFIGELHARLNEKDQAFVWLEKAYAAHSDGLVRLKEEFRIRQPALRSTLRRSVAPRRLTTVADIWFLPKWKA